MLDILKMFVLWFSKNHRHPGPSACIAKYNKHEKIIASEDNFRSTCPCSFSYTTPNGQENSQGTQENTFD